jgi:hypothetical protein
MKKWRQTLQPDVSSKGIVIKSLLASIIGPSSIHSTYFPSKIHFNDNPTLTPHICLSSFENFQPNISVIIKIKWRAYKISNRCIFLSFKMYPSISDEQCLWKKYSDVRFEVFTTVTMKNVIFWEVTLCSFCKNYELRTMYFFAAYFCC